MSDENGISVRFTHSGIVTPRNELRRYTEKLLERCKALTDYPRAQVNVLYCSVNMIRDYNRRYRDLDVPTDVLSFPASVDPEELRGIRDGDLGDLAISLQICNRQAPDFNRATEEEVALMLVHGYLHLIGYDHDTPEREKEMWAETDRILAEAADIPMPRVDAKRV